MMATIEPTDEDLEGLIHSAIMDDLPECDEIVKLVQAARAGDQEARYKCSAFLVKYGRLETPTRRGGA